MKKLAVLLALAVCAVPAFAGETGVLKLSLWGKRLALAVPANTQEITGIDFSIAHNAASVAGPRQPLYRRAARVCKLWRRLLKRRSIRFVQPSRRTARPAARVCQQRQKH